MAKVKAADKTTTVDETASDEQAEHQQVAVVPGAALALEDLEEDSGVGGVSGMEGMRVADIAIPYFVILQKGSPQCDETKDGFMGWVDQKAGVSVARAGMIMNSVTLELIDGRGDGTFFVPCGFKSKINEWVAREDKGGFVAEHPVDTPLMRQTSKNEKKQDVLANGHLMVFTADHYVLRLREDGATEKGIMAMSSTQLKKSRRWNALMQGKKLDGKNGKFTPNSYAFGYKFTTVPESNDSGSWYGWEIEEGDMVTAAEYAEGRAFATAIAKGSVVAATNSVANDAVKTAGVDDEIPY